MRFFLVTLLEPKPNDPEMAWLLADLLPVKIAQ